MTPIRAIALTALAALGAVVGFTATTAYLRWSWNRAMEEAP